MSFRILLFSLLTVFCSFSCGHLASSAPYINMTHNIINAHAKKMRHKYGLTVCGTGGALMNNVKEIHIHYDKAGEQVSIEQARRIMVDMAEELLSQINSHKAIRPYLDIYPFNPGNVEIDVGFQNQNRSFMNPPYLAYVWMSNGMIYYDRYDEERGKLVGYYKEPYEEALRIVRGEGEAR